MIPLNYHHLYYFWVTAKTGSITKAREKLLLAQPTLSLQIKQLEKALGQQLLHRGRAGVDLTPAGRVAFAHCERIFTQGEALLAAMRRGESPAPAVLRLGVAEPISREIVLKVLEAAQSGAEPVQTTIRMGTSGELQSGLERRNIDLAISDVDLSPSLGPRFSGRLAAAIPVRFVAAPRLARSLRAFPRAGQEVSMLLRSPENQVRKEVEQFLRRHRLRASVASETGDSDLIRILAVRGAGVAALNALAIERDVKEGRLTPLNRRPTGIKEHVWFIAGVEPSASPALQAALGRLMTGFSIRIRET